jgi:hypothetical protein
VAVVIGWPSRKRSEGKKAGVVPLGAVLWRVSVAPNLLWRHTFADDAVAPKKLETDPGTV